MLPVYQVPRERYGFNNLVLDIVLTFLTMGLWIFVIMLRELIKAFRRY